MEIVEYILAQNIVDINSRGNDGQTAVMKAALKGKRDVFDFLVTKGANLSSVDTDGNTILYLASSSEVTCEQDVPPLGAWVTQPEDHEVTQNHTQYQSQSNTDLLDACKNGDMCRVKYLLSEGHADINTRGQNGMIPLMLAAQNAHRQVFDFLVGQGASMSIMSRAEMSILHVACEGGNVPIVKYVLEQNVTDINSRRRDGSTAAMLAVFKGHGDVFNLLVKKGADLTLFDDKGSTFVDLAIRGGNTEIVEYVLKQNNVDINRKHCGLTPVMLAALNGKLAVFNFLVQKGADLSIKHADYETILPMACKGGNIEIVKYALEQNIDAMSSNGMDDNAAAVIAARRGHRDIFDLLVKKGANLTMKEENNNILLMACEGGNVDIVKYVLKQNIVDINSKNDEELTPAMVAASLGHKEMFDLLISEGADMTHVSEDDDKILHLACYGGNVDIVKYVLKQKILDINRKDDDGWTPAMMAIYGGHRDILYLLVREGANLTQRNYEHRNVLHVACSSKQTKITKYLITNTPVMLAALQGLGEVFDLIVSKGADLRSVTAHQENILHLACRGSNVEIVKYILSQNIVDDINSRSVYGKTPLMIAAVNQNKEAFDLLVKKGADLTLVEDNGENILHYASAGGKLEIVEYILAQNIVDINSRGNNGKTAVMMAAWIGKRDVFDFLVTKGANLSSADTDGNTILYLAYSDLLNEFEWPVHDDLSGSDPFSPILKVVPPTDVQPSSRWNFKKAN
ncbi:ankyrin repeat domain-containing protein 50-like [Haliotis rufescens]|uniref:ankyrin repeat domain-containing protein 50-like n=1 Tax=Haliotis rufescens TaxID=6454 RepID=UPI00201F588D|nr:ankyrin repeat domain-containing protein 50-like [Haliotis rufescens]